MRKTSPLILLAVISLLFLTGCNNDAVETAVSAPPEKSLHEKLNYIIHGAGALDAVTPTGEIITVGGSSSLEGLTLCAEVGVTAVELDFNFTSDGYLVCVHHWGKEYNQRFNAEAPPTLAEFLECKIFNNFTSISFETVKEFMKENPDVVIVTDVKDNNLRGAEYIATHAPELLDRFVFQIYNENEYDEVRSLGFENIIYSLYALTWNEKTDFGAIGRFAEGHTLTAIAFDYTLLSVEGYLDGMKTAGVPLFVHTVNEREKIDECFEAGISGVYTDNIENYLP